MEHRRLLEYCNAPIIYQEPDILSAPTSWVAHIPFAFWLVDAAKPKTLVELGTHTGNSYCAFCQAVKTLKLATACYAVDTWKGDPHAGLYGEEVFETLKNYHDSRYSGFSRLVRSTFDDARLHFADGSIDILHIDGYHTYEAVKHDFQSWLPKLSNAGVVLFHDTNVRERDFGVWKFYQELSDQFPTFNFLHEHGLAVIAVGNESPYPVQLLTDSGLPTDVAFEVRNLFSCLGSRLQDRFERGRIGKDLDEYAAQATHSREELVRNEMRLNGINALLQQKEAELEQLNAQLSHERALWIREREMLQQEHKQQRQHYERQHQLLHDQHQQQQTALENLKNQEIRELKKKACGDLERETLKRDRIIADAQGELNKLRQQITQLSDHCQAMDKLARAKQTEIGKLTLSRSWRITRPLREVANAARGPKFQSLRKMAKFAYWSVTFQLGQQRRFQALVEKVRETGLFDEQWYLTQYPEVAIAGVDPLLHYLAYGAHEARNPSPFFDTAFYLETNPDVARSGINPLVHFIVDGTRDGRSPHPLFDLKYYTSQNFDIAQTQLHPLLHFLRHGVWEGRNPHPLFDTNAYTTENPEVSEQGLNPLLHFLEKGGRNGRSPHFFFDSRFYLDQYSDVASAGLNPLIHFLTQGWKEYRLPHPLFDTRYYCEHYASLFAEDENPLVHFVREGGNCGCSPNAYFDPNYYRRRYPDVQLSGINPLVHFIRSGSRELRDPSAHFSTKSYVDAYPEVKEGGLIPLVHFLRYGQAEGKEPFPGRQHIPLRDASVWKHYFSSSGNRKKPPKLNEPVSVIIPVYRGFDATKRCIESVLAAKSTIAHRLLLINDHSPEQQITEYLAGLQHLPAVELYENAENLGFVRSVNKGIQLYRDADVVLLNSDTVVPHFWLDRLLTHAYADPQVATVTPFSNNGTICNYPNLNGFSQLPPGEDIHTFDRAFFEANSGKAVEIPIGVGFCMFIRRTCLNNIGLFDEEAFGKGYGEENDLCLRAAAQGWKHLLACDTFVFHEGEQSFGKESSPAKAAATEVIRHRYPFYDGLIAQHIQREPLLPFRIAATAARYRLSQKAVVLFVTHGLAGGTEKHVQEVRKAIADQARVLILRPAVFPEIGGEVILEAPEEGTQFHLELEQEQAVRFLESFLPTWGISRIHIHHTLGIPFSLTRLLRRLQIPFDFTVHDYFAICPQIHLIRSDGEYCGEPLTLSACTDCVISRPTQGAADILSWRLDHRPYLLEADRVFCPSEDVARRLRRYYPAGNFVVVPHQHDRPASASINIPSLERNQRLRIAVMGVLAPHKGSFIVRKLAELISSRELPISISVLGFFLDGDLSDFPDSLTVFGEYQEQELPELIAHVDPHIIWFPARCPETFSFTLSHALVANRPIVAPRLGSFVERLEGRSWTWLTNWGLVPEDLLQLFLTIRHELEKALQEENSKEIRALLPSANSSEIAQSQAFYTDSYLVPSAQPASAVRDLRRDGRLAVLLVTEAAGRFPSPCSYIRLLLPLYHPVLEPHLEVTSISADEIYRFSADVVITNRVALSRYQDLDRFLAHCREHNIKIVYDLDDDLFALTEHPEERHYGPLVVAIQQMLTLADLVWVSSTVLKERVQKFSSNCEIILNALDEDCWLPSFPTAEEEQLPPPVRILYMGTSTHIADLEMIRPALQRLKRELDSAIEIEIIGVVANTAPGDSWCTFRPVPSIAQVSYPSFVRWLLSNGPYDIGLCPLQTSVFNRAKSEIKFLDYAALGAVSVCTDIEPYQRVVRDGENGLLVKNTEEAWYSALYSLVNDKLLRERLSKAAQHTLRADYALKDKALERLASLRRLIASANTEFVSDEVKPILRSEALTLLASNQ